MTNENYVRMLNDTSGLITTDNIESQSVAKAKQADSADYALQAKSAQSADTANSVAWANVTGKPSTYPPAAHSHQFDSLELLHTTPFIDFHYNNSKADFTTRLIDYGASFTYCTNSGIHQFCNIDGSQVARIQSNGTFGAATGGTAIVGSAIYCQTTWSSGVYTAVYGASFTNPSSRLVKENIHSMSTEEAKKLLELNPVTFDYIKEFGGEQGQRGLIAEDTLNIIPSCVTIPEDYSEEQFDKEKGIQNKVLAIDYSKLVPYLIKMVQIQQEQINSMQSDIDALKSKIKESECNVQQN